MAKNQSRGVTKDTKKKTAKAPATVNEKPDTTTGTNNDKVHAGGRGSIGDRLFKPACFYKSSAHEGLVYVYYQSNDNDLSCISRKPDLTATTDHQIVVDVRMFESFIGSWGPVVCHENTGDLFAYIADTNDVIRGLLSGCHIIKGTVAWDEVVDCGCAKFAMGRMNWKTVHCPGPSTVDNPVFTKRYKDNNVHGENQQVGGQRFSH